MLADEEFELESCQHFKKLIVPSGRALWSRREVSPFSLSGITKSHRGYGKVICIVKGGFINTEPASQVSATLIHKRNTRFVSYPPRGLTDDGDFALGGSGQNGFRAERQMRCTEGAGFDFADEFRHTYRKKRKKLESTDSGFFTLVVLERFYQSNSSL